MSGAAVGVWSPHGCAVGRVGGKSTCPKTKAYAIYTYVHEIILREKGAGKVTEGVCDIEAGKISNPRKEVAVYKAGEFRCPNCGKLLCRGSNGSVAKGLSVRCRCHTEVWIEYGGAAD